MSLQKLSNQQIMVSRMAINLEGHELFVINDHWLFDLTTFTGYMTSKNKDGKLVSIRKAYKIIEVSNKDYTYDVYKTNIEVNKIPIGVIRKTYRIIEDHYKTSLVGDRCNDS